MRKRNPQRSVIWAAISLVLAAAVIVVFALGRGSAHHAQPSGAGSSTSHVIPVSPPTSDAVTATTASAGASSSKDVVTAFAAIYADATVDEQTWLQQMSPYVTPVLLASLAGSDRELAAGAGTTLIEKSDSAATIGTGETPVYSLELTPSPTGDDADPSAPPVTIASITYLHPPARSALPLSRDGVEGLEAMAQKAAAAVLAQPGGEAAEDRAQRIREAFLDPQTALGTPPPDDQGAPIRVGTLRDLEVAVTPDMQLALTTLVPSAPDGVQQVRWTSLTIILARGVDGTWVAKDATLA